MRYEQSFQLSPLLAQHPVAAPFQRMRLERGEVKERIASALNTDPQRVVVERFEPDRSGVVLRCYGWTDRRRIFAKIYLADSYPAATRLPRFLFPLEHAARISEATRPIGDQVEAEANMVLKFQDLAGNKHTPALLGMSARNRTLVFEELEGTRLDRLVKWSRHKQSKAEPSTAAMFQAGGWLKQVHDASFEGKEIVDIHEMLETVGNFLRSERLESTLYAFHALRALENVFQSLGGRGAISAPVAVSHGDFSLANLLWDDNRNRLWIIDFEHSRSRTILHDLASIIFNLRARLLYPLTAGPSVLALEKAFWNGYGTVDEDAVAVVNAIAIARIFYHLLPRLLTRRARRGLAAGIAASVYRSVFQPFMIRRVIDFGPCGKSAGKARKL